MIIAGINFDIEPWPEIKTTLGLGKWKGLGTGFQSARDLGKSRDVYESKVLIKDIPSVLDSLQTVLAANRNGITLSGFNSEEIIFGADVDYGGSIVATVTDFGTRKNIYNDAIYELEINFRAMIPPLLTTTPSLDGLNLQEKFEGDVSRDITKLFSYNGSATYLDHKTDKGFFKGSFLQTTAQMKAIRAYLLNTARANAIPFPTLFSTPFRPFGASQPDSRFQKCNIVAWSDKCVAYGWWLLNITFAQAKPYFSAGSVDDTSDPTVFATPSDTSDFYALPE